MQEGSQSRAPWEEEEEPEPTGPCTAHSRAVPAPQSPLGPALRPAVDFPGADMASGSACTAVKIGIIGGTGLDDPEILEGRTEKYVDTPFGKVNVQLAKGRLWHRLLLATKPSSPSSGPVFPAYPPPRHTHTHTHTRTLHYAKILLKPNLLRGKGKKVIPRKGWLFFICLSAKNGEAWSLPKTYNFSTMENSTPPQLCFSACMRSLSLPLRTNEPAALVTL